MSIDIVYSHINDYPFITSIQETYVRGRHLCTGIIIAYTWILTASQCLLHQPNLHDNFTKEELLREPSYYEIVSGTEDLSFGTKFKCKFFVIHHNCSVDPLIFHNGIALIGIQRAITATSRINFINYSPLRKGFKSNIFGEKCIIIGWSNKEVRNIESDRLISVNVSVLYKDECKSVQNQVNLVQSDQYICLQANYDLDWLDISAAVICSRRNIVEAIIVSRFDSVEEKETTIFLALRLDYNALWIASRTSLPATNLQSKNDLCGQ